MTSKPVAFLLADLGVTQSHSRPHLSDVSPFFEAQFKALKCRLDFPDSSTIRPSAQAEEIGASPVGTIREGSTTNSPTQTIDKRLPLSVGLSVNTGPPQGTIMSATMGERAIQAHVEFSQRYAKGELEEMGSCELL